MSESKPCQMTAEEAIYRIEDHIRAHKIGEYPHIFLYEALQMAIDALHRVQPTNEQKPKGAHHKYCRYCGTDLNAPGAMFSGCCWEESKIADNEPLTMEQLRKRIGKPVYLVYPHSLESDGYQILKDIDEEPDEDGEMGANFTDDIWENIEYYGEDWLAYDHKPEGSENDGTK